LPSLAPDGKVRAVVWESARNSFEVEPPKAQPPEPLRQKDRRQINNLERGAARRTCRPHPPKGHAAGTRRSRNLSG